MTRRPNDGESTLESVLWFASSNAFRQLLGIVTAFLRPKLLSPEIFGLFSLFRVLTMMAQHLHLGARSAMRYLGPQYVSRGDKKSNALLQGTAFVTSVGLNSLAGIVLIGVGQWWPGLSTEARVGLYIAAVLIVCSAAYDHFIAALKGAQRFKVVSQCNMIFAVVLLCSSVVLMFAYGFVGAMLAQLITVFVMLCVLALRRMTKVTLRLDKRVLVSAMAVGGPTLLFDLFLVAIRSIDRLIVADTLGLRELGFYALSGMIVGYVLNIPGATREVMEGNLFKALDGMNMETIARTQIHLPLERMAFVMTAFIGLTVIAVPFAIELLLPDYGPGIQAVQILTVSSWFLCVSYPLRGVLVARRRQKVAVLILSCSLAVHAALTYSLIAAGLGISGPALSAGVAFAMILLGHFAVALACTAKNQRYIVRSITVVASLFALMLVLLFAIYALEPFLPVAPSWRVVCQGGIYAGAMAALLPVANSLGLVPESIASKITARVNRGRGSSR